MSNVTNSGGIDASNMKADDVAKVIAALSGDKPKAPKKVDSKTKVTPVATAKPKKKAAPKAKAKAKAKRKGKAKPKSMIGLNSTNPVSAVLFCVKDGVHKMKFTNKTETEKRFERKLHVLETRYGFTVEHVVRLDEEVTRLEAMKFVARMIKSGKLKLDKTVVDTLRAAGAFSA